MKKIQMLSVVSVICTFVIASVVYAEVPDTKVLAGVCKSNCRANEGVICLERGPCEPANDMLEEAARDCRKGGPAMYEPVTKLTFLDIYSQVLRLDRDLPGVISQLSDEQRYELESRLLAEKGIDTFMGTNPNDPLTRKELKATLSSVTIEDDLGVSTGLASQVFNLHNEKLVVYDPVLYVDEGNGYELWDKRENYSQSLGGDKHYTPKLDNCNNARIVFGDNKNGRIPAIGARIKAGYKVMGRQDDTVTKCEIVMLLSNPAITKSLKDQYNPARPLTKTNFADLLINSMHLQNQLPQGYANLSLQEQYLLKTSLLYKKGISVFTGTNPSDMLTREELARVLYTHPVTEIIGVSNGMANQRFELNNAGFSIYDLHAYVNEGQKDEEWARKNNFQESSSMSKDYAVKLDAGNYASLYFGDDKNGKIPDANSPIKVSYRLYSPVTLLTEDDIICVLGKLAPVPVAEAYEPPPPPFDYTPPTDGFDEPATQI
ncbi:MAG: hypothetical protein Q8O12_01090 [Candidatus Omnitrophota bacterium]|nr:hypothetical protein [Candidatus Omnitrophota bacterium]